MQRDNKNCLEGCRGCGCCSASLGLISMMTSGGLFIVAGEPHSDNRYALSGIILLSIGLILIVCGLQCIRAGIRQVRDDTNALYDKAQTDLYLNDDVGQSEMKLYNKL